MNAIIYYTYNFNSRRGEILQDAFEYYVSILENNGNINLLIVDNQDLYDDFFRLIDSKYSLEGIQWKQNIFFYTKKDIAGLPFSKILFVDEESISRCSSLKNLNCLKVLINEGDTSVLRKQWGESLIVYGELLQNFRHHPYSMKMLFHHFKKDESTKSGVITLDKIPSDLSMFGLYQNQVVRINLKEEEKNPHPRFLIEANFFGTKVLYSDPTKSRNGALFRFKDYQLRKSWEKTTLSSKDEIVRHFLTS